jgi:Tfp pilus assembly protein FimV
MKKLVKVAPWIMALVALAFLSGCAAVCGVDEQPQAAPPPPPKKWEGAPAPVTVAPAPAPALPTTYTVEKCDDLWSIAAKPQIYHDALLWPCIFNANKAKIKDANKLKVGTVLSIPRDLTDAQKAACRAQANKFPKFVVPKGAKRYCPPK